MSGAAQPPCTLVLVSGSVKLVLVSVSPLVRVIRRLDAHRARGSECEQQNVRLPRATAEGAIIFPFRYFFSVYGLLV